MNAPGADAAQRSAAQRRPVRRKFHARSLGSINAARSTVPVASVGRFAALHYDPITGRKLEKPA